MECQTISFKNGLLLTGKGSGDAGCGSRKNCRQMDAIQSIMQILR